MEKVFSYFYIRIRFFQYIILYLNLAHFFKVTLKVHTIQEDSVYIDMQFRNDTVLER